MLLDNDVRLTLQAIQPLPRPTEEIDDFLRGHLSQCILSTVYSLGTKATVERSVVNAYTNWANLAPATRPGRDVWLPRDQQQPLSEFVEHIWLMGAARFACEVIHNRQLTSPTHGILRSECCLRFAACCTSFGCDTFQDLSKIVGVPEFEKEVHTINGFKNGKRGLSYFYMLVGEERYSKFDRHVERFLEEVVGRHLKEKDACELITKCSNHLDLTARQVDNMIWTFQRQKPKLKKEK